MPGFGPAPKEQKRRRNADTYSDVQVNIVNDGDLVGPALEGTWSPETRSWWDIWRRSPQAKTFLTTDWVRLRDIARLREVFANKPTALMFAEIRQNEALLGATYTDRLRARMKVEQPTDKVEAPAGVAAIDAYRNRLVS
jgi:hypothetical protein